MMFVHAQTNCKQLMLPSTALPHTRSTALRKRTLAVTPRLILTASHRQPVARVLERLLSGGQQSCIALVGWCWCDNWRLGRCYSWWLRWCYNWCRCWFCSHWRWWCSPR
uniref:Uncharacterized protein n=1 Tax=Oryza punctata TaxID=4537 RepID=A0A0E0MMA3_ORYPU